MSFHIDRIEIIALRKLELVSKVLATKLSGTAGREQKCLADCLGQVLDRYEIEAAKRATIDVADGEVPAAAWERP